MKDFTAIISSCKFGQLSITEANKLINEKIDDNRTYKTVVIIEKLENIDEILLSYEDWMHGNDGDNCTKARKLLSEIITEVKNIS